MYISTGLLWKIMKKRGHEFEIKQGWGIWECLEGGKGRENDVIGYYLNKEKSDKKREKKCVLNRTTTNTVQFIFNSFINSLKLMFSLYYFTK